MILTQLAVEVEPDDCGFHSVIIDLSDDAVLHVSNSYPAPEDAERAARTWIDKHG